MASELLKECEYSAYEHHFPTTKKITYYTYKTNTADYHSLLTTSTFRLVFSSRSKSSIPTVTDRIHKWHVHTMNDYMHPNQAYAHL